MDAVIILKPASRNIAAMKTARDLLARCRVGDLAAVT